MSPVENREPLNVEISIMLTANENRSNAADQPYVS